VLVAGWFPRVREAPAPTFCYPGCGSGRDPLKSSEEEGVRSEERRPRVFLLTPSSSLLTGCRMEIAMKTLTYALGVVVLFCTSLGSATAQTKSTLFKPTGSDGCACCGPDCPCGPNCQCDDTVRTQFRLRVGPLGGVRFRGRIPPWFFRPRPQIFVQPAWGWSQPGWGWGGWGQPAWGWSQPAWGFPSTYGGGFAAGGFASGFGGGSPFGAGAGSFGTCPT
jgi:hypothetical protein